MGGGTGSRGAWGEWAGARLRRIGQLVRAIVTSFEVFRHFAIRLHFRY